MDGVEQPLLLERFPEALNHAGPVDALACQGASRAVISSRNFWAMGEWVRASAVSWWLWHCPLSKFLTSNRHDSFTYESVYSLWCI
jgi:hypothetical protein